MDQSQPKSPREPNRVIGYMASLLLHSPEYAPRISIIPRNHDANGQRNRWSEFHAEPNENRGPHADDARRGFRLLAKSQWSEKGLGCRGDDRRSIVGRNGGLAIAFCCDCD